MVNYNAQHRRNQGPIMHRKTQVYRMATVEKMGFYAIAEELGISKTTAYKDFWDVAGTITQEERLAIRVLADEDYVDSIRRLDKQMHRQEAAEEDIAPTVLAKAQVWRDRVKLWGVQMAAPKQAVEVTVLDSTDAELSQIISEAKATAVTQAQNFEKELFGFEKRVQGLTGVMSGTDTSAADADTADTE